MYKKCFDSKKMPVRPEDKNKEAAEKPKKIEFLV